MKALTNIGIYPTDNVEVQQTIQQSVERCAANPVKAVELEAVYVLFSIH